MITDSHSIVVRWRNHFCQVFNVNGVNDVRQIEILTAGLLVPEPSAIQFEMVIKTLKDTNHKVSIKSQLNLLRQGVEQSGLRSMKLLILFGIRRNCLRSGRSRSLYLFIRRAIKQTVVIIGHITFANYIQNVSNILLSRFTPYAEEIIAYHQCGF